jgi:actin-related protein
MNMYTYSQACIIDNGSGVIKAGLSGVELPSSVFPTIVGRPKNGSQLEVVINGIKEEYIGIEAK